MGCDFRIPQSPIRRSTGGWDTLSNYRQFFSKVLSCHSDAHNNHSGSMSNLLEIPISKLQFSHSPLRPVDKNSLEFLELVESLKTDGILQPVLVRPMRTGMYEVVEGGNRFEAAKIAGLTVIPCLVKQMTGKEALIYQVKAQAVRPKPVTRAQYARRLRKLMDSGYSLYELSNKLDKSPQWIRKQLSLNALTDKAKKKLDSGELKLSNAYQLAHLPVELQDIFLESACKMKSTEFDVLAKEAVADFEAALLNRHVDKVEAILPRLRPLSEVLDKGNELSSRKNLLTVCNAKTPEDGWKACLAWMLKVDPITISNRQRGENEYKAERLNKYQFRLKQQELLNRLKFETGESDV